jgi:hypothetical protein
MEEKKKASQAKTLQSVKKKKRVSENEILKYQLKFNYKILLFSNFNKAWQR